MPARHMWNSNFSDFLPEMSYDSMTDDQGKIQLSVYLERYGIVLLRDVPTTEGAVTDLVGNAIGYVRETNYGDLFDVIDLGDDGNNLAQTNGAIKMHTVSTSSS